VIFSRRSYVVRIALAGLVSMAAPAAMGAQSAAPSDSTSESDGAPAPPPVVQAAELTGSIHVDGVLDDRAWQEARPFRGFTERDPVEGAPARQDTEVRVLVGPKAIYFGIRAFDSHPDSIASQLYRRDSQGQADYVQVAIDPNLDRRTGYSFSVSAANVQGDAYLYDDRHEDRAWNAVWSSAVSRDAHGWCVEIRIPLSQIRYEASDTAETWGIDVERFRVASNERTYLSLVSRLQQGRVSQFGLLEGVRVTHPPRRIQLRPYAVTSLHVGPSDPGNPFFDGSATAERIGSDVSYGLGPAFTVDATLNPDFGQVESDPAVINLSAFETFYQERRPFFVQDARVFDFNLAGRRDQLFYSRRIGRRPHGSAPDSALFSQAPANATILGAAKLTGRTSGGLSLGALAAVTAREYGEALLKDGEPVARYLAEPRTEYGVLSAQQDFGEGNSDVGGILTLVRRDLPADGTFDYLPSSALSGGVRFNHQWEDRAWALWGFFAGSHVVGNPQAITDIQESSNHYFQRPDATRFRVDSTATSLTGADWHLQLDRQSGEHWTGGVWAGEVTKGFEINDLGYTNGQEHLEGGARVNYRQIMPGAVFRNYNVTVSSSWDFSHDVLNDVWSAASWRDARTGGDYGVFANAQLLNYWNLRGNISYNPQRMSRTATRGGPLMVQPASVQLGFDGNTDRRETVSYGLHLDYDRELLGWGGRVHAGVDIDIRPSQQLQISLQPDFSRRRSSSQYVTTSSEVPYAPTYGTRYLFSDLQRETFSMETRVEWTFTPELSLQLYAQPLLSSGDYVAYKQLTTPETYDFRTLHPGTATTSAGVVSCVGGSICTLDGVEYVDFTGDGTADFSFDTPDFNARSLVGNVVLRWEYRPGSTIFFVWQRHQSDRVAVGNFDLGRDAGALLRTPADDRFMIKINYWLSM